MRARVFHAPGAGGARAARRDREFGNAARDRSIDDRPRRAPEPATPPDPPRPSEPLPDPVDEASDESFPASDPPAHAGGRATVSKK
jgi:hypothetical protein